jgi:streptomycin 6-kinase
MVSRPSAVIEVPAHVRSKAVAAGAGVWLEALPDLVLALEAEWSIEVGSTYPDASEAFVAEALLDDGSPAVLKLLIPRSGGATRSEATALRLARGDGCAELFREDLGRNALLLERLGRPLHTLGLPIAERHEILRATARRVWRPAAGSGLPTGAEKGRWLIEFILETWEELGRPCDERTVAHAVACAERRIAAHDDERAVLVHGDVHEWNTLEADGSFRLVDPDGLVAEAEYDMGIVMREDPLDLLSGDPRDRAAWLAHRTGLRAVAIWEWGVVERVSTGLLGTRIGMQPVAGQMLAAAERISARFHTFD